MGALLASLALAALGEVGDKTQLLALALAARWRRPGRVLLALGLAAGLNHLLAAALGRWALDRVPAALAAAALVPAFALLGALCLRAGPGAAAGGAPPRRGFLGAAGLFFLAEMGDKTQVATAALAAHFAAPFAVAVGSTAGMLLTDGLSLALGRRLAGRIGERRARRAAAGLCFAYAALALLRVLAPGPGLAQAEPAPAVGLERAPR
jgi:putative Ca2+/H+ antiporter (TMEM165/GDT1 family)